MKALVVGGNSGIGLAITLHMIELGYEHIYMLGKDDIHTGDIPAEYMNEFLSHTSFEKINLINEEYELFEKFKDINTLVITAGFGRVAPFEDLTPAEITNVIKCNELAVIRIIKLFYDRIKSETDFYCAVMGSIAGHIASPLFSVYGASKSGLCSFIENVNAELSATGYSNRILDVSPGSIVGTSFNGDNTQINEIFQLAKDVVSMMFSKTELYIPQFEETYSKVIDRYKQDPKQFAIESYNYKVKGGRQQTKPQVIVGYLSGTFDLFHVGHLNLLRRAKQYCDYLIVGVHKSGSWKGKETFISHEERMEIVGSIKYVDKVVESFLEDSDAYDAFKYDKLFVGSDYKGSERFKKYEKYFEDKNVEIVYFPYTDGTSSTKIRSVINNDINKHKADK